MDNDPASSWTITPSLNYRLPAFNLTECDRFDAMSHSCVMARKVDFEVNIALPLTSHDGRGGRYDGVTNRPPSGLTNSMKKRTVSDNHRGLSDNRWFFLQWRRRQ